jgi:hypothetical protein
MLGRSVRSSACAVAPAAPTGNRAAPELRLICVPRADGQGPVPPGSSRPDTHLGAPGFRPRAARVAAIRTGGRQHQADGRLEQAFGEASRRLGHLAKRDRFSVALSEQPFGRNDDLLGRGPSVRSRAPATPDGRAFSIPLGQISALPTSSQSS